MRSSTTVVGAPELGASVAARLGLDQQADGEVEGALVCWTLDGSAQPLSVADVNGLESALLEGLTAIAALPVSSDGSCRRIVNLVAVKQVTPVTSALMAAVAGLTKSLARELARYEVTVNAVGTQLPPDGACPDAAVLGRYLLTDDAGFVTGQALGLARRDAWSLQAAGDEEGGSATGGWPDPTADLYPGEPRTVLVSGGAGTIGEAISRRLNRTGYRLVIGYTRREPATALADDLAGAGSSADVLPLDLTDPIEIDRAVDELTDDQPGLHVVLCGGWNRTAPFMETAEPAWRKTLAINLTGPARLLARLVPQMRGPGSAIVGIGSESARVGDSGRAVYAAAKAGLSGLLTGLDRTAANIRATTISPGPVDTPLLRGTFPDPDTAEKSIERLRRLVPLRRLGHPEEVADAVAFALSAHGRTLAGEILSVGGGITMQ